MMSAEIRQLFGLGSFQRLEWMAKELADELFATSVLNGDQASL